jgi:hypothetical protein
MTVPEIEPRPGRCGKEQFLGPAENRTSGRSLVSIQTELYGFSASKARNLNCRCFFLPFKGRRFRGAEAILMAALTGGWYGPWKETQSPQQCSAGYMPLHDPRLLYFFLIFIVGGGVQTGSTRHVGHLLAYCTYPG